MENFGYSDSDCDVLTDCIILNLLISHRAD